MTTARVLQLVRWIVTASVGLAVPLTAQAADATLRAAMLADLEKGRLHVSSMPVPDVCPICKGKLRELHLRDYPGNQIDGPTGETARVCEQDELWLWFPHHVMRGGVIVPAGPAWGPASLRLADCDRTLGPLPWDAIAISAAPSPEPKGASVSAFTPDHSLVVGNNHDGTVRVWTGKNPKGLLVDEGGMGVTGLGLSPRGDALAFARNWGSVEVVAMPGGKKLLSMKAPAEWIGRFAFDAGLRFLAMECQRGAGPDEFWVEVLELKDKRRWQATAAAKSPGTALTFSDDGERLAIGDYAGGVRVWSTATRAVVWGRSFDHPIGGLRFSPDGRTLAAAIGWGEVVQLLAVADGASVARSDVPGAAVVRGIPLVTLGFSRDSSLLAHNGGGALHWIKVGKPEQARRFFPIPGHEAPHFEGQALVSHGHDVRIVWDLGRGQLVR
ncbi:MAG: WD40 repeat domain-containing protein [Planctomycetes bacterium]|nr:WD40 repeat domain-containing protein [Planctomycetota bacterium]